MASKPKKNKSLDQLIKDSELKKTALKKMLVEIKNNYKVKPIKS